MRVVGQQGKQDGLASGRNIFVMIVLSVNDDPRCGRVSPSANDDSVLRVRNVAGSDRRESIEEISAEVDISAGSFHSSL
jgi:hypothetical protein